VRQSPSTMARTAAAAALRPSSVAGVKSHSISLDGTWKLSLTPPDEPWRMEIDSSGWSDVQVPGELSMQGFNVEDSRAYPYRRTFRVPEDFRGCQVLLRFESVHSDTRVWVNGLPVGSHCGPATAWDCDITAAVVPGKEAFLTVEVIDRPEDPSILSTYAGHATGGILRSVSLLARPATHLSLLHVDATLAEDHRAGVLRVEAAAASDAAGAAAAGATGRRAALRLALLSPDGAPVALAATALELGEEVRSVLLRIPCAAAWDAEHPRLHTLTCTLVSGETVLEEFVDKIGFRRITFGGREGTNPRKVYVNGVPVKLRGVNLHDFRWDKGRVTGPQVNETDVAQLKACNVNFIRTSHYPPPRELVAACDRWGVYLEAETAVCFQHGILSTEQVDRYLSRFVEMVEAHRNHPSVLIWSLGNESSWNEGFGAEYDWIKANDPTRPVVFSWPQTIFEEHVPMDIFSIHYVHFMDGFNATNDLDPGNLPCLHDEIAHVACNNIVEIRRDPNVRNFWGESIRRHWDDIWAAEGALGCAIWEAKDDAFFLPPGVRPRQVSFHNDAAGMGGWGCIWDSAGKLKPEAWHVKKAYSPVRIEQRAFPLPPHGAAAVVRVENRFNHASLDELRVEWEAGADTGSIVLPCVRPGQSGVFALPIHPWENGEEILLRFFTPDDVMVDEHLLLAGAARAPAAASAPAGEPAPRVTSASETVTLAAADARVVIDARTGMLREFQGKGKNLVLGGPHLHITGLGPGPWEVDANGIRVERGEHEATVAFAASCGSLLQAAFRLSLAGDGTLTAGCEVLRARAPQHELSEVGLLFDLPDTVEAIQWRREGLWTIYPEDHIGRCRGEALRVRPGAGERPDQIGGQPWPWKDNMRDFCAFRSTDPFDGWATNDFRSLKEHVRDFSVTFAGSEEVLHVTPEGDVACRMVYGPSRDPLVHLSDGEVSFDGPWERVPLLGYNGSVMTSSQAGSSVLLTFEGTGVRIYGLRQPGAALMRVLVDGSPVAMVDPSRMEGHPQGPVDMLHEVSGLAGARHTLKVTLADSHGGTLGINFFELIRPASRPPTAHLIVDHLWNYPQLDWGNFVRPAIRLEAGFRAVVRLRIT
jgi:hypothetical protein